MLVGLTIGQIAVTIVLGVLLPTLFAVTSIVLGKGWRAAGQTLRSAGKIAVEEMGRAKEWVRGSAPIDPRWGEPADRGPRVASEEARANERGEPQASRVRVDMGAAAGWADEAERAAEEARHAAEEAAREAEEDQAAEEAREAEREAKKRRKGKGGSRDRRR